MVSQRGFTLIEVVFAMAIMLIVTAGAYQLMGFLYSDYAGQLAIANMQQEGRAAASIFANEIQHAGLNPRGDAFIPANQTKASVPVQCAAQKRPVEPILEASETLFHFMGDRDGSGKFDSEEDEEDTNEDVRYEWVGGEGFDSCGKKRTPYTLYRNTGGGQQEVALGIVLFHLDYYDENGQQLPGGFLNEMQRAEIRRVTLTVRTIIGEGANKREREWISDVFLKNRS